MQVSLVAYAARASTRSRRRPSVSARSVENRSALAGAVPGCGWEGRRVQSLVARPLPCLTACLCRGRASATRSLVRSADTRHERLARSRRAPRGVAMRRVSEARTKNLHQVARLEQQQAPRAGAVARMEDALRDLQTATDASMRWIRADRFVASRLGDVLAVPCRQEVHSVNRRKRHMNSIGRCLGRQGGLGKNTSGRGFGLSKNGPHRNSIKEAPAVGVQRHRPRATLLRSWHLIRTARTDFLAPTSLRGSVDDRQRQHPGLAVQPGS